jgi:anti-sigma regulatory factor (Ser/Thr protein kinase)
MTSIAFDVHDSSQVSAPRREASALAMRLGFSDARAGQASLVVTELGTNLVKHAKGGQIVLRELKGARTEGRGAEGSGLEVLAIDRGPGFQNLGEALRDGHSTSGTLGAGLGAISRQSDQFDVYTQQPGGTVVVCRWWTHARSTANGVANGVMSAGAGSEEGAPGSGASGDAFGLGAVSVAMVGQPVCGDAWAAQLGPHQASLLVADGLGHGVMASEASAAAVNVFERTPTQAPADLVGAMHDALRATRGAAVAVVNIDIGERLARFAGLGNISATIVTPDQKRVTLVSHNGTAGHIARRVQEFAYPLLRGAVVVLHSDGLTAHWDPADYPGLWMRDPALVAAVLYRDCNRRRDDSTVVVISTRRG